MMIIEEKKGDDTDQSVSTESKEVKDPLSGFSDVTNSNNSAQLNNGDLALSIIVTPPLPIASPLEKLGTEQCLGSHQSSLKDVAESNRKTSELNIVDTKTLTTAPPRISTLGNPGTNQSFSAETKEFEACKNGNGTFLSRSIDVNCTTQLCNGEVDDTPSRIISELVNSDTGQRLSTETEEAGACENHDGFLLITSKALSETTEPCNGEVDNSPSRKSSSLVNPDTDQRFSTKTKEVKACENHHGTFSRNKDVAKSNSITQLNAGEKMTLTTSQVGNPDEKNSSAELKEMTTSKNRNSTLSTRSTDLVKSNGIVQLKHSETTTSIITAAPVKSNGIVQLKRSETTKWIITAAAPIASPLQKPDIDRPFPPPPPAQLFSSHLDDKDISSKSYGRSKRRIKQVIRYDTDNYSYQEMVKRRQMEGKCGTGFLCPRCSEHLSYHLKACVKCGLGCSYVPGSGVIISRDRNEVVKGERILQQRLVECQNAFPDQKKKLKSNKKPKPVKIGRTSKHMIKASKEPDIRSSKSKRSMPPKSISDRREEFLINESIAADLAEEVRENDKEKSECMKLPWPVTLDANEWNPLSYTRLVRMPRYRHLLPRDCVTYQSVVNVVNEKLQRSGKQRPLQSKRNQNKWSKKEDDTSAAEEILYKRGLRARAGKIDSEKLEKISFKDKWEESQRKMQYENRGKKVSAEEAESEKFLCRGLLFDDKKVDRNTRQNICTFGGEKCDLCNGWYASWVLTETEIEKAGSLLGAVPIDTKKRTEIPNLCFRRVELNEIPDDIDALGKEKKLTRNRVSRRSKEANEGRLNELRFSLQFIKRYNDGLLDDSKGSSTRTKK